MLQFHVPRISVSGVVIVHQRLVPVTLRQIQRLPPQVIGDFPSLVMLADGAGAGGEQAVDRVLFVLFLLVHHRAVLPAGIAIVLWGDAVAVFGDVDVGGQKVSSAALALAGRVTVVQSVHQVIGVEIGQARKNHPFYKHHFFFVFRTAGKHIGGGQLRVDRERLHIQAL